MAVDKDVVLIIDNDEVYRSMLVEILQDEYEILQTDSDEQCIKIIEEYYECLSLLILNPKISEDNIFAVQDWLIEQNMCEYLPIILIADEKSTSFIDMAYKKGSNAYFHRTAAIGIILNTMRKLIQNYHELRNQTMKSWINEYNASHDKLTGLYNRSSEYDIIERLLNEHPENHYAMVLFDLDNFKKLNDTHGHEFGDKVLQKISQNAQTIVDSDFYAARIGGDEFMIFCLLREDIYILGEKIRSALTFRMDDMPVTVSIGMVSTECVGYSLRKLFICADHALYASKRNGRNRFTVYSRVEKTEETVKFLDKSILSNNTDDRKIGFFVYKADNDKEEIIHVNEGMIKILGCENEEEFRSLVGNSFKGIVHPDDLERVENSIYMQINNDNGAYDYIEYRIIRKDGSTIWVEDHGRYVYTDEYGYVFYVFVKEFKNLIGENKPKILIIDDQEMNREMLIDILADSYEIDEAEDGEQGIEMLTKYAGRYSMILLDLNMPKVDGYEVLKYMNQYNTMLYLPVIVISADGYTNSINKAYKLGALDVINRPYNPRDVKSRIRNNIELFMRNDDEQGNKYKKKILVADSSALNRFFLKKMFSANYEVLLAEDAIEARAAVLKHRESISVIILDLSTDFNGSYDFIDWMRMQKFIDMIPIVVESLPEYEENLHALYSGAMDYIVKPYKVELIQNRIAAVISRRENAQLLQYTKFDNLTGCYIKQYFDCLLDELLKCNPAQEYDVVWSNIENFRAMNESYGNEVGDDLLRMIAENIKLEEDIILWSRINADHFILVLKHDKEKVKDVLRRLDDNIQNDKSVPLLVMNYGVYEKINHSLPLQKIYDQARLACSKTGRIYKEHISYYDEKIQLKLMREHRLAEYMEEALKEEQFMVYYQPKYSLETNDIAGMEALVRWKHPKLGMVSPGEFIPLFEKNGFISKLDMYVLKKVCSDMKSWRDREYKIVPVSFNASRRDFQNKHYVDDFFEMLADYEIEPGFINMEVTESFYTSNLDFIITALKEMRKRGTRVEMDDFGSGYSCLGELTDMPVDLVKLDMSFVRNIDTKCVLIKHIIALVHDLGLKAIAEGVETEYQLNVLRELKCDYVQGFYYSPPIPEHEMAGKLAAASMKEEI